jgi:hypothetical protein
VRLFFDEALMSEWWTYELSDFLLFSHRVYVRLFELHNAAVWPAHVATLLLGVAILYALLRPGRLAVRFVPLGLGALWIWIAWAFFGQRYATINWAAPNVAPFFALEGVALAALGSGPGLSLPGSKDRSPSIFAALIVLALCLFAYPLLAPALGRPLAAAEVFGIAPDPTAAATLAVLAVCRGRVRWLLMIVPLIWSALTGLTLWTMGASEALIAPVFALAVCAIAVAHRNAA